jgi:hypothetical protein
MLPHVLRLSLFTLLPFVVFTGIAQADNQAQDYKWPNIVYVTCDDLGYGDGQCLNPEHGKIPTPSVDRLATEGMIFTDAHSG